MELYENPLMRALYAFFGEENKDYSYEQLKSGQINTSYLIRREKEPIAVLRRTTKPKRNIYFESAIIEKLIINGFPTPKQFRTIKGNTSFSDAKEKVSYQAFAYVRGKNLPEEPISDSHLTVIGRALGEMHSYLKLEEFPNEPIFNEFGRFRNILERLKSVPEIKGKILTRFETVAADYIEKSNGIVNQCNRTLTRIVKDIEKIFYQTPKQPIHGDFTKENIFFNQDLTSIVGIIDFDDAHIDPRIFDPVIASVYFGINNEEFSIDKAEKIFNNYTKELPEQLTKEEVSAIPKLTEMYSLFAVLWTIYHFNQNSNEKNIKKVLKYSKILQSIEVLDKSK